MSQATILNHSVRLDESPPSIHIEGLCKSFGSVSVYEDFNLSLPNHSFISVFGPNGCGKSTLINMISGLMPYDRGRLLINQKPIKQARIGYVFQNYRDSLFPWKTAYDNIAYPLKARGMSDRFCHARVDELVETFDIRIDLRQYPYNLSGGQQQLVSILRALAADPEVLFLDEPFSALDFETTLFVREKLQQIFMATRLPMLMVVHNLEEAVYSADLILLLSKRPTRVVEIVPCDLLRPRTPDSLSHPRFIETSHHCLEIFRQEMRA